MAFRRQEETVPLPHVRLAFTISKMPPSPIAGSRQSGNGNSRDAREPARIEPEARGVAKCFQTSIRWRRTKICRDLAKTHGDEGLRQWLWANAGCVRQVHLHDLRDGRSHRALGAGTLDFMQFLPLLAGENVLDWCMEVRPREKAIESLAVLKEMLRSAAENPS